MQGASDFLFSLHRRGIEVWNDNGKLRFRSPKGRMLPEEINQLRLLKPEIFELLACTELDELPLVRRPHGCPVPLTPMQSQFWANIVRDRGGLSKRTCSVATRVQGSLDIGLLQSCLDAAVYRHESLRTRIVTVDGLQRQHIDAGSKWRLEKIDLTRMSSARVDAEITRFGHELVDENVNVSVDSLFAARLFKLSADEYVLLLAIDHLVTDGVSKTLLNGEIWALYNFGLREQELSLPEVQIHYPDFAVWEQRMRPIWRKRHGAYWENRLAGAQPVQLPRVDDLTEAQHPVGRIMQISLGEGLSTLLRDLARREGMLLSLVVLALYVIVVSRWCSQRDVLLLMILNGRDRPELESMQGFMANTLYFRAEISHDDTFVDVLQRVALEFSAAYEHQRTGIEFTGGCTTEMLFNWRSANHSQWSIECQRDAHNEIRLRPFPFRALRPCTFLPIFAETSTGIEVTVMYRPDVFSPSSIEQFGRNLCVLADEFARRPLARVGSIQIRNT